MQTSGDLGEYRIVVRGAIGRRFSEVFDSMDSEPVCEGEALVGRVRDQSELQGMVDLLCGLGVQILSVNRAGLDPL